MVCQVFTSRAVNQTWGVGWALFSLLREVVDSLGFCCLNDTVIWLPLEWKERIWVEWGKQYKIYTNSLLETFSQDEDHALHLFPQLSVPVISLFSLGQKKVMFPHQYLKQVLLSCLKFLKQTTIGIARFSFSWLHMWLRNKRTAITQSQKKLDSLSKTHKVTRDHKKEINPFSCLLRNGKQT